MTYHRYSARNGRCINLTNLLRREDKIGCGRRLEARKLTCTKMSSMTAVNLGWGWCRKRRGRGSTYEKRVAKPTHISPLSLYCWIMMDVVWKTRGYRCTGGAEGGGLYMSEQSTHSTRFLWNKHVISHESTPPLPRSPSAHAHTRQRQGPTLSTIVLRCTLLRPSPSIPLYTLVSPRMIAQQGQSQTLLGK
jgi:hypothetical protein